MLAAGLAAGTACADAPVSFSNDVLPVLEDRCASCHLTGQEEGKLALAPKTAYASLVGAASNESPYKVVKAGAPDESYLVMKLDGTQRDKNGKGARMPFGQPPLDDATRKLIRKWIAQGAPNN
jgi:hypothetical protein